MANFRKTIPTNVILWDWVMPAVLKNVRNLDLTRFIYIYTLKSSDGGVNEKSTIGVYYFPFGFLDVTREQKFEISLKTILRKS